MPWLSTPRSFAGSKFATTTTWRPTSAAPRRGPRPRRSPRGRAGSRPASWLAVHVLELAREALAQLAGDGRRHGRSRRRRPHPAADDERHTGRARQDGSEGRHPREPVEAAKSRRGEHLLAVAGAEGGQDRVLVLAAREAPGDLLLHRLARRAVEVVAGVDGEPAAALAGERLLDLLLGRGDGGRREDKREREDRAPHSAGTCARPSSYATARRSAADGHIVTSVPPAMMTPPIQSHDTSGFT